MLCPLPPRRSRRDLHHTHHAHDHGGEAHQWVEGRRHVSRHFPGDEQLRDERSEADEEPATHEWHDSSTGTRSRMAHGGVTLALISHPCRKTSTHDMSTTRAVS